MAMHSNRPSSPVSNKLNISLLLMALSAVLFVGSDIIRLNAHRNLAAITAVKFDESWPMSARYEWADEMALAVNGPLAGSWSAPILRTRAGLYQSHARAAAFREQLATQVLAAQRQASTDPQSAMGLLEDVLERDPKHLGGIFALADLYQKHLMSREYQTLRETAFALAPEFMQPDSYDPGDHDIEFLGLDVLNQGALEVGTATPVRLYWRIPQDPGSPEIVHYSLADGTLYRWLDRVWWEGELINQINDAGFELALEEVKASVLSEVERSAAMHGFARVPEERGLTVVEWDYGAPPQVGTRLYNAFLVQTRGPYVAAMAIGQEGFTDTAPLVLLQLLWHPDPIIVSMYADWVRWNGWRQRAYLLNSDTDSDTTHSRVRFIIKGGQVGSTLMWDDLMLFDVSHIVGALLRPPERNARHDE